MDKLIIPTEATGFPEVIESWEFLEQLSRKPLEAIGKLIGHTTVITGVMRIGNVGNYSYTDGVITFKNEIMPFIGGADHHLVSLFKVIENANFNIDVNNDQIFDNLPAYERNYAKLGDHPGAYATFHFRDLRRLSPIENHLVSYTRSKIYLGNVTRTDQHDYREIEIIFDEEINVTNYRVIGVFSQVSNEPVQNNNLDWSIKDTSTTGFILLLQATGGDFSGLFFEYDIVATTVGVTV